MAQDPIASNLMRIGGSSTEQLLQNPTRTELSTDAKAGLSPAEITAGVWSTLQGTWAGNTGLNIIATPSPGSTPTTLGSFTLIVNAYLELLVFTNPGAPARNRGGDVDQFVAALEYEQRVTDKSNNELLHVETGMFLNLSTIVKNGTTDPEPIPQFNIARSGTVPHGDSITLLGVPPVVTQGPPPISAVSSLPTNLGPHPPLGYTDPYLVPHDGLDVVNPNAMLLKTLADQQAAGIEVLETTTFTLDSANSGAVVNIPYIVQRANTTSMNATFWLEKMRNNTTGQEFDQLQYSQTILIEFHQNSPSPATGLIVWPHITTNTLVKQ